MNNSCLVLVWALLSASVALAAERLKQPPGPEDLDFLQKNRGAQLLKWEHPQYPPEPGAEWVQQAVRVAFEIDPEGRVVDPRVLGGAEKFQAAALAAVARWTFRPETVDGQPATVTKEVRITFTPQGTPKKSSRDEFWSPYQIEAPELSPPGEPANPEAIYPARLMPRRLSGEVELELSINKEGRVDGLKVLRATHPEFLSGALETVAGWQMRPARRGKVPQPSRKGAVLTFYPVDEEGRLTRAGWLERNGITLQQPAGAPATERFDPTPGAVVMVDPVYPHTHALAGTRGAARVNFSVNRRGRVEAVTIEEASAPEFGEALAAAIAAWQFQPLQRGGETISADFGMLWRFEAPPADSVERRLLESLGTEAQPVSARSLDRPLYPLFIRQPVYPAARLEAQEAGRAEIEVTIDRAGRVRLPHIRGASDPAFGWAAATAVSQWLFETPLKDGKPVDVRVVIPVEFKVPPTTE